MFSRLIALVITILVVRWVMRRYLSWRKNSSPAANERALFKQRLPEWVKSVEMLIFIILLLPVFFGLFFASLSIHHFFHPLVEFGHPSDAATGLFLLPEIVLAGPLAMVLANLISWLIPSMRKANEHAMQDLPAASYRQMTRGLLIVLAWIAPFALVLLSLGVIDPWI